MEITNETQIYDGGAVCGDGVPGGAGELDRAGHREGAGDRGGSRILILR